MRERLIAFRPRLEELAQRIAEGNPAWVAAAVLAVSAVALALLLVVRFVFRRLSLRIGGGDRRRIPAVRWQNQEFLAAEETTAAVLGLIRLVRLGLEVFLAYGYLNVVFQLVPFTKKLGDRLLGYLVDAVNAIWTGVIGYLPSLVFLIVLFFFGRWLVRLVQAVFLRIAEGRIRIHGFEREWAGPTFNILRVLIVAFLAVIAFPYLPGSASPAFQGISIFVGVLVSLGSTAAIADVTSGIVLTYTRAFSVGDRVRIADAEGDIVEKTLFVTRVRTVKNVDITIPNALVMSNHIINFSAQARAGGLVLHTTVTLGYDVPWQRVHQALIDAALATDGIVPSPEPFVLQTGLDDFYVHYELNAVTRDPKKKALIYSALHQNMLEKCHAAGIEIASPHLSAVRDGNQLQMPDDYLPKNYAPAAFRVWRLPGVKKDEA